MYTTYDDQLRKQQDKLANTGLQQGPAVTTLGQRTTSPIGRMLKRLTGYDDSAAKVEAIAQRTRDMAAANPLTIDKTLFPDSQPAQPMQPAQPVQPAQPPAQTFTPPPGYNPKPISTPTQRSIRDEVAGYQTKVNQAIQGGDRAAILNAIKGFTPDHYLTLDEMNNPTAESQNLQAQVEKWRNSAQVNPAEAWKQMQSLVPADRQEPSAKSDRVFQQQAVQQQQQTLATAQHQAAVTTNAVKLLTSERDALQKRYDAAKGDLQSSSATNKEGTAPVDSAMADSAKQLMAALGPQIASYDQQIASVNRSAMEWDNHVQGVTFGVSGLTPPAQAQANIANLALAREQSNQITADDNMRTLATAQNQSDRIIAGQSLADRTAFQTANATTPIEDVARGSSRTGPQIRYPVDPDLRQDMQMREANAMHGGMTREQAHAAARNDMVKAGLIKEQPREALGGGAAGGAFDPKVIENMRKQGWSEAEIAEAKQLMAGGTGGNNADYMHRGMERLRAKHAAGVAQAKVIDLNRQLETETDPARREALTKELNVAQKARVQNIGGGSSGLVEFVGARPTGTEKTTEFRGGVVRESDWNKNQKMQDRIKNGVNRSEIDNLNRRIEELNPARPPTTANPATYNEDRANDAKRRQDLQNQLKTAQANYDQQIRGVLGDEDYKWFKGFNSGAMNVAENPATPGRVPTDDVSRSPYYTPPTAPAGSWKPGMSAASPAIQSDIAARFPGTKPIAGAGDMTGREAWRQASQVDETQIDQYLRGKGFNKGTPDYAKGMDTFYANQTKKIDLGGLNLDSKTAAIAVGIQQSVVGGRIGGKAGWDALKGYLDGRVTDEYTARQAAEQKAKSFKQIVAEKAQTLKAIEADDDKASKLAKGSLTTHDLSADELENRFNDYMASTANSSLTEEQRKRKWKDWIIFKIQGYSDAGLVQNQKEQKPGESNINWARAKQLTDAWVEVEERQKKQPATQPTTQPTGQPASAPATQPAGQPAGQPGPKGMLVAPTLDLTNRPRVKNADGTISTIRTIGIETDGKYVLVPTVSDDGRIMSNDEAFQQCRKTGKHVGIYDTKANADAAGPYWHNLEAAKLAGQPAQPVEQPTAQNAPDGIVIENDIGQQFIKRGGIWQPL
jgi:hypothetical protein